MPTLPSGRRIEFSLDRFHGYLDRLDVRVAREIIAGLNGPDDLLYVLDAVHFRQDDGSPYFAGYVAADWTTYAADWNTADRQVLQAWLFSPAVRQIRAEVIDYVRTLFLGASDASLVYPYVVRGDLTAGSIFPATQLRQ